MINNKIIATTFIAVAISGILIIYNCIKDFNNYCNIIVENVGKSHGIR